MKHSASSISTFCDCPTKWARIYLDGVRAPSGANAQYGTFLHAVMEHRRKTGEWPLQVTIKDDVTGQPETFDVSAADLAILEEARPLWEPYHLAGHVAEGRFEFPSPTRPGRAWSGIIDLRGPGAVEDYKSTGDFRWAKGQEQLRKDPQAQLYAYRVATSDNVDFVDLDWIYMKTTLPNASKSVKLRVLREEAQRAFDTLEKIADMAEATKSSATAPRNTETGCKKYGGCPFKGPAFCNITPWMEKRDMSTDPMDLLNNLTATRVAAGLPAEPSPLAPAASAAPPAGDVEDLLGMLGPAIPAPQKTASGETVFNASWAQATDNPAPLPAKPAPTTAAAILQAVNPPAPAAQATQAAPPPAASATAEKTRIRRTADEMARGLTVEQAIAERAAKAAQAPKDGSTQMAVHPAMQMAAEAVIADIAGQMAQAFKSEGVTTGRTDSSAPTVANGPKADRTKEGLSIGRLYVGCLPLRGAAAVVHFDMAVAHARVELAKAGCADFRLVEFGKGKAYLLEHVVAYLARTPGADVFVAPGTEEATVCLAHLRAAAQEVVQALGVAA